MKKLFSIAALLITLNSFGQYISFPKALFADSGQYRKRITILADEVIPVYKNTDKAGYYNDLFRLYFAKNDYAATLTALDSFAA